MCGADRTPPGKDALFRAVLEGVELEVTRRVRAAGQEDGDPADAVRAGCLAWIELAGDPVVQRIVLLDAPAVLGWQRWREFDEQHALGMLRDGLAGAHPGGVSGASLDTLAHVLLAGLNELAMLVARAPDPVAVRRDASAAVHLLLDGLTTGHARG